MQREREREFGVDEERHFHSSTPKLVSEAAAVCRWSTAGMRVNGGG